MNANALHVTRYVSRMVLYGIVLQTVCLQLLLASDGRAQKSPSVNDVFISVNLREASPEEAFRTIEAKTVFSFAYDRNTLADHPITLRADQQSVAAILVEISRLTRLRFKQVNQTINVKQPRDATSSLEPDADVWDREITGIVTDLSDGSPLPGVNVLVKGSTVGTVTDIDGNYRITVSDDAETLVFTYVGYEREEVALGDQTVVDMALAPDVQSLSEVVVVGYGTQERSKVSTAISEVSSEDLESLAVTRVDEALQGRATGVDVVQNSAAPGGDISIRIRGIGTPTDSDPTYIVDGVQVNSISELNPNDIASVSVLKDQASAAIYGTRSANGIVLITTKRGEAGEVKLNFDAYYGVQQVWNRLDLLNATQYATIQNEARTNDGEAPVWPNPQALGVGTDWQDEVFRTGNIQQYNLAARGGSEKTSYLLSGSYFANKGIVIGSDYERFTVRFNSDNDIKSWLRLGNSLTLGTSQSRSINEDNEFDGILNVTFKSPPTMTVFDATGAYDQPGPNEGDKGNPVASVARNPNEQRGYNALGNVYVEIEPIENLVFRTSGGLEYTLDKSQSYNDGTEVPSNDPQRSQFASLSKTYAEYTNLTATNTISYARTFGEAHNLDFLVGHEVLNIQYSGISGSRRNFPNSNLRDVFSLGSVDITNGDYEGDESLLSYFGRVQYDYQSKYLFSATVRRDGSSKFGPENKWGTFGGVSAGWRIIEEDFMAGLEGVVSDLKLRASWGTGGNDQIGNFGYLSTLSPNYYVLGAGQMLAPGQSFDAPPVRDLRWEETRQTNVGIDAAFLDGKLLLTADYYLRNTQDVLVQKPVPLEVGAKSSPYVNAGSVENRGIEIGLNYRQRTGDFQYEAQVNFSTLNNEVTSLGGGEPIIRQGSFFPGLYTRTEEGEEIASYYGYVVDGIFQTEDELSELQPNAQPGDFRFRDLDDNGVIDSEDRQILGSYVPDYFGSVNLNASYKNLDFTLLLNGRFGMEILNTNLYYQNFTLDAYNKRTVILDRWQGPNTSTTIPRLTVADANENRRFSSYYVEDGSFVRIKNIQLGYSLSESLLDVIGLDRVRVYVGVQNLFTFTDYSGFDPEIGSRQDGRESDLLSGVDFGNYPVPRTYLFGLNVSL